MADDGFKLNGWHAAGIFAGAFGLIFAVNGFMAYSAVSSFPGLETENSYIASQTFDDRRAAQEALGWDIEARLTGGEIVLSITDEAGRPVQAKSLEAVVGRPTSTAQDIVPDFVYDGRVYVAPATLAAGNWDVWLTATAPNGTPFEQRLSMRTGD